MDLSTDTLNRRIQALVGGLVFIVAFFVYYRTVAPTTSFWDCGEFIACSRILGVMHPPGAPLYLVIGRIMTLLPFFNDIGLRVNFFSVLVSAATVLLTYLIIMHLIRLWRGPARNWEDRIIMIASGVFGAMAFAFTDSFWFNAVEAEVYAFSMFFTALVIWLTLWWGEHSEEAGNLLIIFFIFYLFGLAIGVHLLNILTFPFILLIVFFHHNVTARKLLLLVTIQAVVPIVLYMLFYQYNPEKMTYTALLEHQDNAANFLKIFGSIWMVLTLGYFYFKDRAVFKIWWIIPVLVFVAFSTYLIIYFRSTLHPPINENDPSNFSAMVDYLARKQYGSEDLFLTFLYRKADFWGYQIQKMYVRYFGWQFIGKGVLLDGYDRIQELISFRGLYGIPFLVGLWGAVHHFFKDWRRAVGVLILFFLTGLAIILYVNQPDPQPRERDYSYVGSFFAFALWIGIGLTGILEWLFEFMSSRSSLLKKITAGAILVVLFLAVPVNLFAVNFESHDRTGDYVAWDYSYNILESCEPDAILFTNGDNDTFPLWYLQEVEGIRKDVRVINLSLLNTDWYIKQLRDMEPRVPIGLSDQQIEGLSYYAWESKEVEIPVPDSLVKRLKSELRARGMRADENQFGSSIRFTVVPTFPENNPQALRVQDLMILRILSLAQWQRPVYVAVTVSQDNQLGLQEYLRMDGLAYKVLPYRSVEIDPEILSKNLLEKFKYRGLNDPKVHLNTNTVKLLINVRQGFLQLASHYLNKGKNEEALSILDAMEKHIPKENVPYSHEAVALSVAEHFERAGRQVKTEDFTAYLLEGIQLNRREKLHLANYYYQIFEEYEKAERLFRDLIQANSNDIEAHSGLYDVFRVSKQTQKAAQLLEEWLLRHPGDTGAQGELESLRKTLADSVSVVR